jgi:CrcB protein
LVIALRIADCGLAREIMAAVAFVLVGLGGAVGSVLRYAVSLAFAKSSFPYATLLVNVAGCLVIGLALPAWNRAPVLSENLRLLLVVGLLGGFTTFSAFGHETVVLLQHSPVRAVVNVLANVSAGLGAVLLGRAIALRLLFA